MTSTLPEDFVREYTDRILGGDFAAQGMFEWAHHNLMSGIHEGTQVDKQNGSWDKELAKAAADLQRWTQESGGRKQNYTPEELVQARFDKTVADYVTEVYHTRFLATDAIHQAVIALAIQESGLAKRMVEEGKAGKKFGILELTSRLAPTLTFPGSSAYFEVGVVPYGKDSRLQIGEEPLQKGKSYVSAQVAIESAANLCERFNLKYAIAETSAAPRGASDDVPKSRIPPRIFIASGKLGQIEMVHHDIQTPFRAEFNSHARELMYNQLIRIYAK